MLAKLARQRLRQIDDRRLGGAIGRVIGHTLFARPRGHVDDRTRAARDHRGQRRLAEREDPVEVDCEDCAPVAFADLQKRSGAQNPGIVDENADGAKLPSHRRDAFVNVSANCDVTDRTYGLAAERTNQAPGLVDPRRVAIEQPDIAAAARKPQRNRTADPGAGAGDQRNLTVKLVHDAFTTDGS